jgi:hypothetical protein
MITKVGLGTCCVVMSVVGLVGCDKSGGEMPAAAPKTPAGGATSGQTKDAATAQRRFPELIEFDNYTMRVPSDFKPAEIKQTLGDSVKIFAWKGEAPEGEQPNVLTVAIRSDEKAVAAAKQDMRKDLVDYSAGMCNSMNVAVARRDPTETGAVNGLEFSRYKWFGRPKNNAKLTGGFKDDSIAYGITYGFIDGSKVMLINLAYFGAAAKEKIDWAATMVATLEKK